MESILQSFANNFVNFFVSVWNFFNGIIDTITTVSGFIISIFWFVFYALKTLVVWIYKLVIYISGASVPAHVVWTLAKLSVYIWPWGVLFITALLTIIFVRIIYAFFFKMLFNPTYKPKHNWEPTDYVDDITYPRIEHK